MPWKDFSKVPPQVKKHKGARLNLSQANYVSRIADATGDWAIAWKKFTEKYKKVDGRWVKK